MLVKSGAATWVRNPGSVLRNHDYPPRRGQLYVNKNIDSTLIKHYCEHFLQVGGQVCPVEGLLLAELLCWAPPHGGWLVEMALPNGTYNTSRNGEGGCSVGGEVAPGDKVQTVE